MSIERPGPTTEQLKRRRRFVGAATSGAFLLAAVPFGINLLRGGEEQSGTADKLPVQSETSQTVPESSFASAVPSDSPSASSSVEASPAVDPDKAPEKVLDIVPRLGLLTYSGGANMDTSYASGVVIGPNQFLTSADLFGPLPDDPAMRCGDYRGINYEYSITTGAQKNNVISVRRHPNPTVDLAILTVAGTFAAGQDAKIAQTDASGFVYALNFQEKRDGGQRTPSTGPNIFAGELTSLVQDSDRKIDNSYYGPAQWNTALVLTPDEFGFNPQTGAKDTAQEGSAGKIGSGGPIVTSDGTIVGIQTAHTVDGKAERSFLATRVTQSTIDYTNTAPAQAC